jgi:peptidoglycan hydrolase CwlO-like protein
MSDEKIELMQGQLIDLSKKQNELIKRITELEEDIDEVEVFQTRDFKQIERLESVLTDVIRALQRKGYGITKEYGEDLLYLLSEGK